MMFRDVITLVSESPAAHGVLDDITETQKQVYCSVRSVGMSEAYQAMSNGLHPQFVFVLSDYADYGGEKVVIYNGIRYRVIRTYRQNQGLEMTVEEVTIDA
jgi:transposase